MNLILNSLLKLDLGESLYNLWKSTGLYELASTLTAGGWQNLVMILISCVLFYLAIVKKFEPLLLLPIAFGMFIINIPGAYSVLYGQGGYTFTDEAGRLIASGTLEQLCSAYGLSYSGASAEALQTSFDGLINFMHTIILYQTY